MTECLSERERFPRCGEWVECIKEFHSLIDPDQDHGVLGKKYEVIAIKGYNNRYLNLRGLAYNKGAPAEYLPVLVNADRFKTVTRI